MRVSIIALLAGSGLLVSACSPPIDDPKAPPAEAAAAQPATAPSGSVEAKPAVSAEKEEQSGPEAAEGVAKERELFTVEHGDVYGTTFYGLGVNPNNSSAWPRFGENHDTVAVLIGGDGKEPFSGVLMINCDAETFEWTAKSDYGSAPHEVVAAARKEFCPAG